MKGQYLLREPNDKAARWGGFGMAVREHSVREDRAQRGLGQSVVGRDGTVDLAHLDRGQVVEVRIGCQRGQRDARGGGQVCCRLGRSGTCKSDQGSGGKDDTFQGMFLFVLLLSTSSVGSADLHIVDEHLKV